MTTVNGERLWQSIEQMGAIGATAKGGVRRLALTAEEKAGRDQFVAWCREADLIVRIDAIGNIFGRREGTDATAHAVLCGSHLDTQPEGGRFDGAFGVLAALEIVRTLNDANIRTRLPIEIVSWTNEEGARFTPSLLGSGVFASVMPLSTALDVADQHGVTVGEALRECGYAGEAHFPVKEIDSYFEAHIEQGPILENNGTTIGVVTGGQAIRWLDVTVQGFGSHAGTTPMVRRKDAFYAVSEMALALESMAQGDPLLASLATVGQLNIANASRNTIAGNVFFSVDLRHPKDVGMADLHAKLLQNFNAIAERRSVSVEISTYLDIPATPFDPACRALVQDAAQDLGYSHQPIISGAGHDAVQLAKAIPVAMVFIPCVDGLSHNEEEDALPEDVVAGANVLLHAVLNRAGVVG
ncbi:Zn-dependent hydrolase [Variovorax sp. 770b2]|uniref:Zn-dependent hydrolase n=1 Tax=Variovorax sp. 770b2 TaxID=1566271 RepID=UPI0008E98E33|nr:Zn-dependent hydrolase [Variovorax sp. 770b2]SFQ33635.1 N-carbamoyl-L-amino-acid hydrolase [Variovorax sp. 770b2]